MELDFVIVDDSSTWLSLAHRLALLNPSVRSVRTFHDSFDAWVHLQVQWAHLLMTDIEMP